MPDDSLHARLVVGMRPNLTAETGAWQDENRREKGKAIDCSSRPEEFSKLLSLLDREAFVNVQIPHESDENPCLLHKPTAEFADQQMHQQIIRLAERQRSLMPL